MTDAPAADETSAPEESGPRTGSKLVRATFPFMEEDLGTSWRLLIVTLVVLGVAEAMALSSMFPLAVRVFAGVIATIVDLTRIRGLVPDTETDTTGTTDADVLISVTPPPQMPATLDQGTIQGYCVGEPWNQQAVFRASVFQW